jgi:hypothetical protein
MVLLTLWAPPGAQTVEEPGPLGPPPGVYEFRAGGNASWVPDGSKPSFAEGGVQAAYEGIRIHCERLELIQAVAPGTTVMVPNTSDMVPGPHGPANGKVVIDTRDALNPRIGFKGLLTPESLHVRRQTADAALPGIVQYRVELPEAGDFSGQLKRSDGSWAWFRGWARQIEIEFAGDTASGSLANLHMTRLILRGREAKGEVPSRMAEINRLKPEVKPEPEKPLTSDQVGGHIDAPVLTIDFDGQGRAGTNLENARVWGDPQMLNLR